MRRPSGILVFVPQPIDLVFLRDREVHTLWWLKSTAVIHILGFRCFFFFAYKYLYTCLAGTPAQPYSHKG